MIHREEAAGLRTFILRDLYSGPLPCQALSDVPRAEHGALPGGAIICHANPEVVLVGLREMRHHLAGVGRGPNL